MSRSSWERADHCSPITHTASKPLPWRLPHSLRNPVIRVVEVLVRGLYRAHHPVIDLAQRDRVEQRGGVVELAPADGGHPEEPVGSTERIAASTSMPSGSCAPTPPITRATGMPPAGGVEDLALQLAGLAAQHDLIIGAVPLSQFLAQPA